MTIQSVGKEGCPALEELKIAMVLAQLIGVAARDWARSICILLTLSNHQLAAQVA